MNFSKIVNPLLFTTICLIWGSSFILMKLGMYDRNSHTVLTAYQVASIRILSAGVILIPFLIKKVERFKLRTWGYIITSGLLGIFLPAFLFCIAETRLDSGLAGTLNALTPFFTIIIGFLFFKKPVPVKRVAGIVIGFSGILFLFAAHGNIKLNYLSYSSYIILATICYGLNTNLVRNRLQDIPAMTIATLSFVALIAPAAIILWLTGYFSLPLNSDAYLKSTIASCALGILGSALTWILFYMLIKRSSALFASSVTFVIPIVALGWGWIYGESISTIQIICLSIILTGVYLTNPILKKESAITNGVGSTQKAVVKSLLFILLFNSAVAIIW